MADTLTKVANEALISIGVNQIKSLEDIPNNPNASSPSQAAGAVVNIVIDAAIRHVQSEARWSDLDVEAELHLQSEPSEDVPVYEYAYPTDVLGYVELVSGAAYHVRSQRLYTRDPGAILRYVRYSREPSEWNPHLTDAVVTELAARVARKLTDLKTAEAARALADRTLIVASTSDSKNRSSSVEKGAFFELNQVREGAASRYAGVGQSSRPRRAVPRRRYYR